MTFLAGPGSQVVAVKAHDQGYSPQSAHEAILVCDGSEVSVCHVIASAAVEEGGNPVQRGETPGSIAILGRIERHSCGPGGAEQAADEDGQCVEQSLRIGYRLFGSREPGRAPGRKNG